MLHYPLAVSEGGPLSLLDDLLAGIVSEPQEETRWLVLADYLEENNAERCGELLRLHRRLLATCCEPDKHPERGAWQRRIVELINQFVYPCVPQERVLLGEGLEMKFSFIPPGEFLMGSNDSDPAAPGSPVHKVKLTSGFYLGIQQVTQAQWKAVMGTNPSYSEGVEHPVTNVSWDGCQEFCQQMTKRLKRKGVCRLPTEAEWEYACRAGTTTQFYTGDADTVLKMAAWFSDNSTRKHHPVGELAANAWGIYDMHGNVWEWCGDWFEHYSAEEQIDPTGPVEGVARVNRGGSAYSDAINCRSQSRQWYTPAYQERFLGFRVCLQLD
jgi:uncharacterized protein (TIGR02996 family)